MNGHIYCCCGSCYSLTDCATGVVTYTETDLSAHVGRVVAIGGVCYEVAVPKACVSPADVTVTDNYDDCADCADDQGTCLLAVEVAIAGLVDCAACIDFGGESKKATGDDANGTYVVDLVAVGGGVQCSYNEVFPDVVNVDVWDNVGDCSGAADSSDTHELKIVTVLDDDVAETWLVEVWAVHADPINLEYLIFRGTGVGGHSAFPLVINNDLVVGDCGAVNPINFTYDDNSKTGYGAASGGTVTLDIP